MGSCVGQPEHVVEELFNIDGFVVPESLQNWQGFRNRDRLYDVLCHPQLAQLFKEYLRSIYSKENLMFFLAVEEYRQNKNASELFHTAHVLYDRFFKEEADEELSIEFEVRVVVEKELERLETQYNQEEEKEKSSEYIEKVQQIFDESQILVLRTLEAECIPKFVKWQLYMDFISDRETRRTFLHKLTRSPSTTALVRFRHMPIHKW
eukprot:TRINITY_DN5213_c0_g1_i2.p1 TRINITY_DN5213_c0_g1~~TRINITY_DN5213_c0_g1_i2.p1  ORF type:complete len:207 (+),score=43.00 TRINITY_DN5213_c0_g1_i2:22-642(+)